MIRYVLFVSTQKSEQYVGSTSSICTPSSFYGRHFNRFHCQPQKKIKFSHFLYQCTIEYSYKEAKRNEKKYDYSSWKKLLAPFSRPNCVASKLSGTIRIFSITEFVTNLSLQTQRCIGSYVFVCDAL